MKKKEIIVYLTEKEIISLKKKEIAVCRNKKEIMCLM
jgi:hypothetical protein